MLTTLPCQVTQLMDYSVTSTVSAYRLAGLVVNVKKTEVLPQASQQHIICPATIYRCAALYCSAVYLPRQYPIS